MTNLEEEAWDSLVYSLRQGKCAPFLGAGIAFPYLPTGAELAQTLSSGSSYPFDDTWNLPRVAQYIASVWSPELARGRVAEAIQERLDASHLALNGAVPEAYRILAKLPIKIVITTNYDHYMERALQNESKRPETVICRWANGLQRDLGRYPEYSPSELQPAVFHLHGALTNRDSILLTEDDYVTFLANLAITTEPDQILWHAARRALSENLLFVGYSLEDWNFRVLLKYVYLQQLIAPSARGTNLSIQLSSTSLSTDRRQRAENFLAKYFGPSNIRVHWCDATEFLSNLNERILR